MPRADLSASEKRKALKSFGIDKPKNLFTKDIPMAAFPNEIDSIIRISANKIALALYYRHKSIPAKRDYWVGSYWTQSADRPTMRVWSGIAKDFPFIPLTHVSAMRFHDSRLNYNR